MQIREALHGIINTSKNSGRIMNKTPHFLLSTTRMWNCGDDFIAFGVRNLITQAHGSHVNFSAYNRAPELHQGRLNQLQITIDGKKEDENVTNTEVSVVTLDVRDAKLIPVLLGEQDH